MKTHISADQSFKLRFCAFSHTTDYLEYGSGYVFLCS